MDEAKKAVDILGVPVDLGVKELGLKLGPDALREAGLIDIARRVGLDVRDLGNVEKPPLPPGVANGSHREISIASWCQAVAEKVAASVKAGRLPLCLGGDHSLAIGSLAGAVSHLGPVGCLWMDAHPDANTPETSPSGNIHGMPVAIILGHGPKCLVDVFSPGAKVAYEHMSLLGVRDVDPGEAEFVRHHNVQMFTVYDVIEQGLPGILDQAIERVACCTNGVHVSLDLDVLHEDIAPGVGLPSRCGFDMREATYICQRVAKECRITSMDIVGLNPVRDKNMRTARRAVELLMTLLGSSFSFSYQEYLRDQK